MNHELYVRGGRQLYFARSAKNCCGVACREQEKSFCEAEFLLGVDGKRDYSKESVIFVIFVLGQSNGRSPRG
jgi:hypothetical protein